MSWGDPEWGVHLVRGDDKGNPREAESIGDGGRAVEWGGRVLGGGRQISLDSSGCPGQTLGGPEWRGIGGLEEGISGSRKCHELMEENFS